MTELNAQDRGHPSTGNSRTSIMRSVTESSAMSEQNDDLLNDDVMSVETPLTRSEMLSLPQEERQAFLDAECRELTSIEYMGVEEGEVPIPKGVKPLSSLFVYKDKDPIT